MLVLLLAGSMLLYVDLARMRVDPLATAIAGALVLFVSLAVGTMYASINW